MGHWWISITATDATITCVDDKHKGKGHKKDKGKKNGKGVEATTSYYTWGLDLSGTLAGAGGVGGLLCSTALRADSAGTYFPFADANGNITEYVDASGTVVAHYEYSPFGKIISQSGAKADEFNILFSTKYLDRETGLYYYGYRYYDPELGRWLSRDPIASPAFNLYLAFQNRPTVIVDRNGCDNFCPPDQNFCCGVCQNAATPCMITCAPEDTGPGIPWAPPGHVPGTNVQGGVRYPIPGWFRHPKDEGKTCCCEPPAKLIKFARNDDVGLFTIKMKLDFKIKGCYKDVAVVWWTCWRIDHTKGIMPGCVNIPSCTLHVIPGTPFTDYYSSGPHMTIAIMRFLSCENEKWIKHEKRASHTYMWKKWHWE